MTALQPVHRRLLAVTGGAAVTPLVLLFCLNLVDELDRVAFVTLAPEIRDSFGLSEKGFLAVVTLANAAVIFGALPIGRLADRVDRVRLARVVALFWAVGSILVGLSPVLAVLVVGRLLGGLGRIANEPLHASLLADFYAPAVRPRVFATHRLASFVGLIGAPLGAGIAIVAGGDDGWRWAFGFLALPTVLIVLRARTLKDPGRHGGVVPLDADPLRHHTEAPAPTGVMTSALVPDAVAPPAEVLDAVATPSFRDAMRLLAGFATLRRLWLGAIFFGAGAASLPVFIGLYADDALGFGPGARAALTVGLGVGGFCGLLLAGRYATRAAAAGDVPRLATLTGLAITAGGLALVAASPLPAAPSVVLLLLAGLCVEAFFPSYLALIAEIVPGHLRAQAYGSTITAVGVGAIVFGISLGGLADAQGYRVALGTFGAAIALGGIVVTSARSCVVRDLAVRDRVAS